ncbi:GDSL esterase/lipase [Zostera marina]|uniref:GDSL esterase/lipase n=1 Tax=Zostera marina TaxID=29655 RepID=A0A0K9NSD9_ZOSMR|nr:GDSL esterase/lipase [Zostera marina]
MWSMTSLYLVVGMMFVKVFVAAVDFKYPHYPAVFNFGDSNSDTGGLVSELGKQLNPPYGNTHFGRPEGRFCDGRLVIDFFMNSLKFPALHPYLDSVGGPDFKRGCNFAMADSTILPNNTTSNPNIVSPLTFGVQVDQFIHFRSRVLQLLRNGSNSNKLLPLVEYFSQGLYTFDIGQFDLARAFENSSEGQVLAYIPILLIEFASRIKDLYANGARRFRVYGTGPFGCLPKYISKYEKDALELDELGCVKSHNYVAKLFNLQINTMCSTLQADLSGTNFTYIDMFALKTDLIANYTSYGFENSKLTCCGGSGGSQLNYNSEIPCDETKIIDGNEITSGVCKNVNIFIYKLGWSSLHRSGKFSCCVKNTVWTI